MSDIIKAERLEDVYKTVSSEPLTDPTKFQQYYRKEVNELRGQDWISLMKFGLEEAFGGIHYKSFLMGHSGVGKSTELTRLIQEINHKYQILRFSVTAALDPNAFQPFDVILYSVSEIVSTTAKPIEDGGAGERPRDSLLQKLYDWFGAETETITRVKENSVEIAGGLGIDPSSPWAKILGLFASLKGEMRYASSRTNESTSYRLSRLSDLVEACNNLLDACNDILKRKINKEWLVIAEDFDKEGIPLEKNENLFVTYSNVIRSLRAHLIFVIPIALGYCSKAHQFPVPQEKRFCLPDTPVFQKDHTSHEKGREAVRAVLDARMSLSLFEEGQLERIIVASGGNLRDLFTLVSRASVFAVLSPEDNPNRRIRGKDVGDTIRDLRSYYERLLGESPYEAEKVTYAQKAERLVDIYSDKQEASVPDSVLYSLLRSRAVQEFNGERWMGIHPLVVDILVSHGRIARPQEGSVPGGTLRAC